MSFRNLWSSKGLGWLSNEHTAWVDSKNWKVKRWSTETRTEQYPEASPGAGAELAKSPAAVDWRWHVSICVVERKMCEMDWPETS